MWKDCDTWYFTISVPDEESRAVVFFYGCYLFTDYIQSKVALNALIFMFNAKKFPNSLPQSLSEIYSNQSPITQTLWLK